MFDMPEEVSMPDVEVDIPDCLYDRARKIALQSKGDLEPEDVIIECLDENLTTGEEIPLWLKHFKNDQKFSLKLYINKEGYCFGVGENIRHIDFSDDDFRLLSEEFSGKKIIDFETKKSVFSPDEFFNV